MCGVSLRGATDYYQPFPDPESVFASKVEEHAEYLLPVGTLSLSRLSPDWSGNIHFLLPVEPLGGYGRLGEQSIAYHNYLCRTDWLGYHLRDNKCELACDFRYFHKKYYAERPPQDGYQKDEAAQLDAYYQQTHDYFNRCRQNFQKYGFLNLRAEEFPESKPLTKDDGCDLVNDLGGLSFSSNWSVSNFPMSCYLGDYEVDGKIDEWERVVPQTEDGRDFVFIGQVDMWNYMEYTNGSLLLFYDPVEKLALSTIDWG
ncbi:hypothetical protein Mal35_09040 [Gimesia maris]|uniref:hypothetical protein n=1 Tax=Gimesia maris TaxID=122 RepID=UPI00118C0786|nr:hypothetical protein [Gimesia maris]QDT77478.1 hypothetical protein Mal35_09040 [Gimesia maris]